MWEITQKYQNQNSRNFRINRILKLSVIARLALAKVYPEGIRKEAISQSWKPLVL